MMLYFPSFYPSNESHWFALTLLAMVWWRCCCCCCFFFSSNFLPTVGSSTLICVEKTVTNEKQTPYLSSFNISVWIINKHSFKIRIKMCTNITDNTHRRFGRFHFVSLHKVYHHEPKALH